MTKEKKKPLRKYLELNDSKNSLWSFRCIKSATWRKIHSLKYLFKKDWKNKVGILKKLE